MNPLNEKSMVLVIDDDAEIVSNLTHVLTSAGYTVHCCRDGESALEAVHAMTPDLVISDINLAGHSGLALCERLQKEEGLAGVPVMFLSGAQIPDIIRRSRDAGGTYYLRKPFDPSVLLELVDKALWMPHLVSNRLVGSQQ